MRSGRLCLRVGKICAPCGHSFSRNAPMIVFMTACLASDECLVRATLAAVAAGFLSGCPRAAKSPVPPDRPIVITRAVDGAHEVRGVAGVKFGLPALLLAAAGVVAVSW